MKETEEILSELGFIPDEYNFHHSEYYNESRNMRVSLKGDGIYAYSVGTIAGDDYLEMHLNFIPEGDLLRTLLKKVFYI